MNNFPDPQWHFVDLLFKLGMYAINRRIYLLKLTGVNVKSFLLSAVLVLSATQAFAGLSHEVLNFNAYAAGSISSAHSDYPNMYAGSGINLSHFTVYGYAETAGQYSHSLGGYVNQVQARQVYLQTPQVSTSLAQNVDSNWLQQRRNQFSQEVRQISSRLANLPRTSQAQVIGSTLVIRALNGYVTVVDVSTSDMNRNISIEGDYNSLVVIRMSGSTLNLVGRRTSLVGLSPNQVVFYSSSVTSARLMDSGPSQGQASNGLMGSWILPNANVDFSRALIVGNLMTASISTSIGHGGQVNSGCFQGLNSIGVGCDGPYLSIPSQQPPVNPPPCSGYSCGGDIPLH